MTNEQTNWNYEIETWYDGDQERTVKYGRGNWDQTTAARRLSAAIRATDKIPGLYAVGNIIQQTESE